MKLNFGEERDAISDNGAYCGKVREVQTGIGEFSIVSTAPGRWWAALARPMADGTEGPAIWEEVYPTKAKAVQACQDYYDNQTRYILQEAFGTDDDAPLILTGKHARRLRKWMWDHPAHDFKETEALQKAMDEQGVARNEY